MRFTPIERLNSEPVVSQQPNYLDVARDWSEKLDLAGSGAERRLHVYPVQNSKASNLARILSSIFAAPGEQPTAAETDLRTLAPGREPAMLSTQRRTERPETAGAPTVEPFREFAPRAEKGEATVTEGDGIRFIADESNNTLLILATL